jgi:hypothetical protein
MTTMVSALLKERLGYLERGMTDSVREVDVELRKLGFIVSDEVEEVAVAPPKAERAVKPKTVKRTK